MFSLIFAAYLIQQVESAQLASQVASCISWNDYSCEDRDARNNDDLVSCLFKIEADPKDVRQAFNLAKDSICPCDPNALMAPKMEKSWNY